MFLVTSTTTMCFLLHVNLSFLPPRFFFFFQEARWVVVSVQVWTSSYLGKIKTSF